MINRQTAVAITAPSDVDFRPPFTPALSSAVRPLHCSGCHPRALPTVMNSGVHDGPDGIVHGVMT